MSMRKQSPIHLWRFIPSHQLSVWDASGNLSSTTHENQSNICNLRSGCPLIFEHNKWTQEERVRRDDRQRLTCSRLRTFLAAQHHNSYLFIIVGRLLIEYVQWVPWLKCILLIYIYHTSKTRSMIWAKCIVQSLVIIFQTACFLIIVVH